MTGEDLGVDIVNAPIVEKFGNLQTALRGEMIERNEVIDTMILALVAGVHHFQLGEPGVAKSRSIVKMVSHIDGLKEGDFFETLMTRTSTPEEINGPVSLKGLEEDSYRFVTAGYAPVAKIWFLDEVWKANSAILNTLLWALNERKFRNDGKVADIPLHSMFCASNELPDGEELNAIYDRIHFRHIVKRIQEPGAFIAMLQTNNAADVGHVISWDEIAAAHKAASEVEIPRDVLEAMNTVRQNLRTDGIEPTDRRFKDCLRIVQAAAFLDGRTVAEIEHMRPLAHCLWTSVDEQPKVERMLLELANPLDKEALELLETVEGLAAELDKVLADQGADGALRSRKGVELHAKVERAKLDLKKLTTQVDSSKRKSAKVEEVRTKLLAVTQRLISDIFTIDAQVKL